MKKIGALFASIAMALCLTACSNNSSQSNSISAPSLIQSSSTEISSSTISSSTGSTSTSSSEASPSSEESSVMESESTAPAEPIEPEQSNTMPVSSKPDAPVESEPVPSEPQNGRTLVVYFSASGNTKAVADIIAAHTNADTFELVPTNPYSSADLNYNDPDSRVCHEHDNPDARDIELEAVSISDWTDYDTVFIGYPIWWQIAAWPVNRFVKANDFSGKTVIPFATSASSGLGDSGNLLASEAGSGNWTEGRRFSSHPSESDVNDWLTGLGM